MTCKILVREFHEIQGYLKVMNIKISLLGCDAV
jgi:hypothetical protein